MVRAQALRAATRPAAVRVVPRARTYATDRAPNPAPKGGNNTLLYTLLAAGAGGGAWYYYSTSTDTAEARRKADQEAVKGHLNAAGEAAKAGAKDALTEGQQKYGEVKGSGQDKLAQARASAEQAGADAQSKLDAYKSQAKSTYDSAAASAQEKYEQARISASSTLSDAEKKLEEAKVKTEKEASSWWSWLTFGLWGSAPKKEEGADKVKQESASLSEVQRKV